MTEHQAPWPDGEVLAGIVERVTFHNAESGFAVLRVKARRHRDLVTIVGHATAIAAGEWITATGEWVNDRTHGQQFKARFLKTSAPTTAAGIERYLGSGMIRGIGPVYAKKLVRGFGEAVFDIIEGAPQHLREVGGIGEVRAKRIVDAWAEQKVDTSKNLSRRAQWADSLVAERFGAKRWPGDRGSSTWTSGCGSCRPRAMTWSGSPHWWISNGSGPCWNERSPDRTARRAAGRPSTAC